MFPKHKKVSAFCTNIWINHATHPYFLFVEVPINQKKASQVSPKANSC